MLVKRKLRNYRRASESCCIDKARGLVMIDIISQNQRFKIQWRQYFTGCDLTSHIRRPEFFIEPEL